MLSVLSPSFGGKKVVLLLTFLYFFVCQTYAQEGTAAKEFNFTGFSKDKVNITRELDSLTSDKYKTHPEYGVLPFNAPCKDCIELLQQRDETHRYFVKEGTKGKEFYQQTSYSHLNYRDKSGVFHTIDKRLRPAQQPGVYVADHQYAPVAVNIADRFSSISNAGKELQFNRDVHIFVRHDDGSSTSLGEPDWSDYTAGDDGAVVHNLYPGIDLELHVGNGHLESFYRLNRPLQLGEGWLVIRDNMKVPDGLVYDYSYSQKVDNNYEGTLFLNDRAGTHYFFIGTPAAYDENNENNNAINLTYQVADNGTYDLYVPISWMNDSKRSYPLIIDPFVSATSTLPQASIMGSGYNATCFQNGCTYNLAVAVPPACVITGMTYSFNYVALGTCNLDQGAWDLTWGACRSPSAGGTWHTCAIGLPGLCILEGLSCFNDFQACLPAPSCNPPPMNFTLTFYRCVQPGAGCGFSCINADTSWVMTVTGRTVDVTAQPVSVCQGSSVSLSANATWGVPPYTYTWYPGGIAGNPVTVSPPSTTTYSVTVSTCNNTDSAQTTALVTVFPYDNPGFNIDPNPVCQNSAVTITGLGNTPGTSYNWLLPGSNLGSQNNMQDVNGVTYAASGNYNIILNYTDANACMFPDTQQITVNPNVIPSVVIAANPFGPICPGTNVTFTATPTNGGAGPVYQWYLNGSPVGTNSNMFSSTTLNNGDVITVHIISDAVCPQPDSAVSNVITMDVTAHVVPSVNIVANPTGAICPGDNVTFTATPNFGGTNPSYQWYVNGNAVGTNSTTFSSTTLNNGDVITVHLLNSNAPCVLPDSAVSNIITIIYNPPVAPTVSIVANPAGAICPGANVTFTATPANGGATPSYQWYLNGNPVGNNSTTYSSNGLNNGDVITVHLLNASGECIAPDSAVSNAITIIYGPPIPPTVSIAAIPSGPICPGASVTFTATPTNGGGNPSYQWYDNGNPVGANSVTYSSTTLNNGDIITVHLLNATGACISPDTAVSDIITIIYSPPIPPAVSIAANPSGPISPGTRVTFTATPTNGGNNPGYQWYLNGNPVGTNNVIFTSSTLIAGDAITVDLLNATGPCISPDSAVSDTITISISPLIAPTVSITAADTICPGQNVTFTATITNGGANPGYQWYLNGNPIGGANSSSYSSTIFHNGDVILVNLINAVGPCISPDSAVSNSLTIVYNPPVVPTVSIAAVPAGIICQGQTVTFTATETGGGPGPTYQWLVNSNPSGNGSTFSSSSLTSGDVVSVVLTSDDPCANPTTANSNPITIQYYPPMTVAATGDTTICPGESVPINSVAGGGEGAPYTYSWNGGEFTDSNAIVTPLSTTLYAVSATDACGSTPATGNVTVTVSPVPTAGFSFNPSDPTEYSRTVYFNDQSSGAVSWNWNFGDPKSADSTSTVQNPSHTFSGVGTFTVKLVVTNAAGCIDSIDYVVDVTEEYAFYIPNSFTPNGDGINDYFGPQGTHDLIYEMEIYDRWGEKIFETINTSLPWNGEVSGSSKIAEPGVYVYRVKFQDPRYTSDVIVGSVTLVR